ncbi:16438_t:CDS:2, partial [Dentiscutata heterogama]
LLNMDFMERSQMMWCMHYPFTWFMVNANETYLTTMNELAVSKIEFNKGEQEKYITSMKL